MNIEWEGSEVPKLLYFRDLKRGETFRIVSSSSKGAVYRKVEVSPSCNDFSILSNTFFMEELATGIIFDPTLSPVELVEVQVKIKAKKPQLIGY